MKNKPFTIKTMTPSELDIVVDWAAKEGWNPGLSDAKCYYLADPNGFLMGYLGDEPIASISVVKYNDTFGFLGFYIVKPQYRGLGYGWQIWQAGLQYLHGCNIALDGVVAQQGNYKKTGFKLAYRNIRFAGSGGGTVPELSHIVPINTVPLAMLFNYEQEFFPANRNNFLSEWVNQPNSHALAVIEAGQIEGYGVIRPCQNGYKIGPLFANTVQQAQQLFQALRAKTLPCDTVFLDVPEVNDAAVTLAKRHGMLPTFETARMYTIETPNLPLDRIYGVTSFEIG
ncbi:GNAT family N-acetyltransferase [Pseudoalteromonas byunsanensis]|uniref:GNAT family N-acetyltransferase n=1 Tax=Pseudoalteromonas byunsanensis TaxID=327939 RepID=A0A1S1N3Q4_9GAMM|nr:GNAT family N-acetyltransferase [Pseudoalteromonas byunsanensis]OHU94014.1 GNAT family N-acetyltransferase [Pseudoalteromonas byunsanensis]